MALATCTVKSSVLIFVSSSADCISVVVCVCAAVHVPRINASRIVAMMADKFLCDVYFWKVHGEDKSMCCHALSAMNNNTVAFGSFIT
jgi:hypothetical protein